jgi:hypothetical protein
VATLVREQEDEPFTLARTHSGKRHEWALKDARFFFRSTAEDKFGLFLHPDVDCSVEEQETVTVTSSSLSRRVQKMLLSFVEFIKSNSALRVLVHKESERIYVLGFPQFEGVVDQVDERGVAYISKRHSRQDHKIASAICARRFQVKDRDFCLGDVVVYHMFYDVKARGWRASNESCVKVSE